MIRRLRAYVPAILVLGLTGGVALTLFAQAVRQPEYPTIGEMHRFVFLTLLSGAGTVILIVAGVYVYDQRGRSKQLDDLATAVRGHHENWVLHPTGSTHRIDEFDAKLSEVHVMLGGIQSATMSLVDGQKRTVRELETQDGRLRAVEGSLQALHTEHAMLHGRSFQRDPMDSPNKRRATDAQEGGPNDSGDDFRTRRGAAK